MYFISSRIDLDNEDRIAPSESYWDVAVENRIETERREVTVDELKEAVSGKVVLVLVHGYNNEFDDIVRAYDIIREKVGENLDDYYDDVIGYTWPGGNHPLDWAAPKRRAGLVAPRFGNVLRNVAPIAEVVDVMSHSLGARVALRAINDLPSATVRANYLLASAVDNESVEKGRKYFSATQRAESVIFYSKNDRVLRFGYSAAEWDFALGYTGPEDPGAIAEHSPNVSVANCKRVVGGHGEYKSEDAIYRFIAKWLNGEVEQQFVSL